MPPNNQNTIGPSKGDIIPPPEEPEQETPPELPSQEEFWRPPVRFGSIPVDCLLYTSPSPRD